MALTTEAEEGSATDCSLKLCHRVPWKDSVNVAVIYLQERKTFAFPMEAFTQQKEYLEKSNPFSGVMDWLTSQPAFI